MKNFINNFSVTLKTALTTIIVVMILFLMVNVLFFAYQGNKYVTFIITEKLMYQIFSTTAQKLNFYLLSSSQSLKDMSYTVKESNFDLEKKPGDFLAYLKRVLLVNNNITGAYLGDNQGNFYMAKRMTDGSVSYRQITRVKDKVITKWTHPNAVYNKDFPSGVFSLEEGYDPRVRPWYIKAKKENKTVWTDPYIFASDHLLGLSVATPIKEGKINGVLALDFGLADIGDFLSKLPLSKISTLFILDKKNRLITYSSPHKQFDQLYKTIINEKGVQEVQLLDTNDINDDLLTSALNSYFTQKDSSARSSFYNNIFFEKILSYFISFFVSQEDLLNQNQFFFQDNQYSSFSSEEFKEKTFYSSYRLNGDNYLFMLNDFNIIGSFESKLGIVLPEAIVVSYFYYTYLIILFTTIVVVVIGLLTIVFIINKNISQPIFNLSRRMVGMIDNFQLNPVDDKVTKLKEIRHIRSSLESVRKAFVSFKKYLPQEVVAELIKSGKEAVVGGEKKEITIFFSDIQDFTRISEENPSDILLNKLQEYFNICYSGISKHNGIVDKYIGDAVMALWGVLGNDPNHCTGACLAALEIKEALTKLNKKLEKEEFPVFITRIGIHTGVSLVGNIGSDERLNYTCLGDSVNLASRLEGLNKFYKTQILASNMTLQLAKEFVEYRMVDRVFVKGKSQRILLHEIIARKGELYGDDREHLQSYKEGSRFYSNGYWDDAIKSFKKCLELKPDDYVSHLYVEKSQSFVDKKIDEINPDDLTLNRRLND